MYRLLSILALLTLAGCASVPESIKVSENQPLVDYSQATSAAKSHQDATARWGGVIAAIDNLEQQTRLEVVHYPLSSTGRPQEDEQSVGRFRVYVDGFLDPMVFKTGKAVTVVGQITGIEDGQVGEHKYRFPTLVSNSYYLWKPKREVETTTFSIWGGYGWHGWHMWPYYTRSRVVVHKRSGGGEDSKSDTPEQPKQVSPRVRPNRPEGQQMRPINTERRANTERH
ncbi:putative lipoprotein YeaY [Saliniradius amylolyticus]|uniref:Putative lipoprotein YeaY n=1 Tax=Saliniradius amylolyticus TaxID=2183582 RepID=A0A2S2E5Q9_9ALTE|nr:Slp family lipoprotein [Saliniradius amylolyticus]AWL12297.1 putative lipoprotein YeaY [Saliniradius amylolyticus]